MNSILLDDLCEATVVDNSNGLKTLEFGCGTPIYSQLVKLKLLTFKQYKEYEFADAIDWINFIENPILGSVLGTQISALIGSSTGVESVDLSGAEYSLGPSPRLSGICFTVECEKCVISL